MTAEMDRDAVAGEYVLGTLDATERAEVERRRPSDRALDQAIADWERRLGPLVDYYAPVDVPNAGKVFAAIEARISARPAPVTDTRIVEPPRPTAEIITLQRRVRRWQMGAVLSGALAASLAAVLYLTPPPVAPAVPSNFVAVLQKDQASPGFLVSVDIKTRQMTVRQVAADKLQGKSYELWLINDRYYKAPKSLGVVQDNGFTRDVTLASYAPDVVETALYAVTLEPEGGSPTGGPTGPIVFTGKLLQATP